MRETLMWNRWCKCFRSGKEAQRDDPSKEKMIEKSKPTRKKPRSAAARPAASRCDWYYSDRCYRRRITPSNITALVWV